jgi:predicted transcriptional regulator
MKATQRFQRKEDCSQMKNKKVLLLVEPVKNSLDRAKWVLKTRSKKYSGMLIISFPDFETLGRVISGARIEPLHAIRVHKPKSIQELAKKVDRDFKNVYQDVKLLAEYGLIELKESGPRKASKPEAKFSELVLAA